MAHAFYPFVENEGQNSSMERNVEKAEVKLEAKYPARIAVYDDAAAAPRVVVVEPKDVRDYLEEITNTVVRLEKEQGGSIPFMVIREVVENFIHAYFIEPTISILDGGETIRFSDQGPGIKEKDRALEYGTSSATEPMKQFIRGVGSGLPYAQQYMEDRGGTLTIADNISGGTVVTLSTLGDEEDPIDEPAYPGSTIQGQPKGYIPQQGYPQGYPQAYPQQTYVQGTYGYPQYGQQLGAYQPAYQQIQQGYPMAPAGAMPQGTPYSMGGAQLPMQATPMQVSVTNRGMQILSYLTHHESVGPTELSKNFEGSQPTWSRELRALEQAGLIHKSNGSQKRGLTPAGKAFISQFPQM